MHHFLSLSRPRPGRRGHLARRLCRPIITRAAAAAAALTLAAPLAQAYDTGFLQGLLDQTPEGGWVKASIGKFSDAWASAEQGGLPDGTYSNPATVVTAWSSFAWDSNRGNLLLWGGGHANYMGNEMYIWQGTTGTWTRGSLPSRLEFDAGSGTHFVVDDAAPQSAHTYDNSVFAPINDRFVTFGGAAFNSGGSFVVRDANGEPTRAGPWLWNPQRADANKVGGTTGSGYLPATPGGEMWSNQFGRWSGGAIPPSHLETNSAYRQENGKDVIYVTGDSHASGWQSLYRYELGDVDAGEFGVFERVGSGGSAPSYQSAAAIDSVNGLYVRTSAVGTDFAGLGVWNLAHNNAADPDANGAVYVELAFADGSPFAVNRRHGIAFDERSGKLLLWDGEEGGTLYQTQAVFDENGEIGRHWIVVELSPTTEAAPRGLYSPDPYNEGGVLGKFQYIPELGAFVVLDQFDPASADAAVWLYKPVAVVPEPAALAMMLGGLAAVAGITRRRRVAAH